VNHQWKNRSKEFHYLCVDEFIENTFYARALTTAFEIGLIDFFLKQKEVIPGSLSKQLGTDSRGMLLLLDLLLANRVVENCRDKLKLTDDFAHALNFRDLLELRLTIANFAAHDFLDTFTDLVCRPTQFFEKVRFCRLFAYDRCFHYSEENYKITRRWMQITTTLTKYESQVCMKYHDFSPYRHLLDLGGNSGEFVRQICQRYPEIQATVFDLPLVCDIGRDHLSGTPEAKRITFLKGNALTDEIPGDFDIITFKSMLHDWPEKEAKLFIAKASQSLTPGGTLLIFERGPLEPEGKRWPYSILPMLLFYHSFRSPGFYEEVLKDLRFREIAVKKITLDTPFYLVTARKKG